ncbi:hypothetical protein CEP52_012544 [Fusarium oligoseptatum]|uniref:Uncharacterized protein n=1 Tax=Fusarium oligoseptatum TaxID=2604345 RepID=A0A428SXW5_9HYPO|nr:hypothetical protein CEP52_012544 [Fusarium oligoseptatum]
MTGLHISAAVAPISIPDSTTVTQNADNATPEQEATDETLQSLNEDLLDEHWDEERYGLSDTCCLGL